MRTKIIVLCMGLAAQLHAQTPLTLTFQEAVKIGLERNLALNQAKNVLMATTAERNSGMLQLGPTVNASGSLGTNDGNSFNQQKGRVVNGVVDFMGTNINASMPLFNGMSNYSTFRQLTHTNEAQLQLVKRTSQDVIRNVANQFLICLLDQRLVLIQQKNVETQRKQYDQISEQVKAGSRPEVDTHNQDYQVKNAELLLLRAINTQRNNKTILAATLQLDPVVSFELSEPVWTINSDFDTQTVEAMSEVALTQRSDLANVKAAQKAAQFGYYANKGNYLPSVSAFAQYGSRFNYVRKDTSNRTFNDQFLKDNVQLTYGVSFSIPLYGGFQTRARTVRSKIIYENAKLTTKSTELIVKTNVLLAHQNFKDAKASYDASNAQLKAAEVSYNFEKERYDLGASDIVALTLATQNHTRAQADFENAKYTLMFQQIMLSYSMGTLRYEDIP